MGQIMAREMEIVSVNGGQKRTSASGLHALPGVAATKRRWRSWSTTLFRKAFHIKGNDDLRGVSLTNALQVF
jgi:hypothetical protein